MGRTRKSHGLAIRSALMLALLMAGVTAQTCLRAVRAQSPPPDPPGARKQLLQAQSLYEKRSSHHCLVS
jgi:hypothetical protein